MESLDLDESIKREAFLIAKGRQEVADKIKRPEGKFGPYTPLETNWQGAIAEVFLKHMFPSLLLSQPYVIESDDTTECDFIFEKEGIEVKCNRFHEIYPKFFVNKTRFLKKFDHTRKVVCCAINDSPSKASKFYIFGWLEAAKVKEYPVETRYSSPAYAVPIEDFLPMDKLFDNPLWHARRDRLSSNQHQGPTRPVHGDLEMSLPLNQVVVGDCAEVMRGWPADSIDLVVTSPPYWGLRDYGTETVRVWGGLPECEHEWMGKRPAAVSRHTNIGFEKRSEENFRGGGHKTVETAKNHRPSDAGKFCSICGAWTGSLGLEPHPQLFIDHLVEICREIKRVLKPTGTFWLNLGDTYYGSHAGKIPQAKNPNVKIPEPPSSVTKGNWLQPKQKLMMPSRVAIALQHEGWILRSDIIWDKPNAMPSSVKDRLSCAYEHVFLFVKNNEAIYWVDRFTGQLTASKPTQYYVHDETGVKRLDRPKREIDNGWFNENSTAKFKYAWQGHDYYFDLDAIRKPFSEGTFLRIRQPNIDNQLGGSKTLALRGESPESGNASRPIDMAQELSRKIASGEITGKNPGDLWRIPTTPFPGAHFATFPPKLIEPIVKAGSPRWICSRCGKPRKRITKPTPEYADKLGKSVHDHKDDLKRGMRYDTVLNAEYVTTGWSDCGCGEKWVGGVVLDPFGGSGTVGQVARRLGRRFILIEIIPEYCKMAEQRVRGKYKPAPEGVTPFTHEAESNG